MKKLILILIASFVGNNKLIAQTVRIETFDTKASIQGWTIKNNGVMQHTNQFTFNGKTFSKPTKDSFLVFYDTAFNWAYSLNIVKKFKVIPSSHVIFRMSLFSEDSAFQDYILFDCRIIDKDKKTLYTFPSPRYAEPINQIVINYSGFALPSQTKPIWKTADSMEIWFHFNPAHPYDSFKRMIVIDEIYYEGIYVDVPKIKSVDFDIFPNPATETIYFKFDIKSKPSQIILYDFSGRLVDIIENKEQYCALNISPGMYFIHVRFENGTTAYKKVEIYR